MVVVTAVLAALGQGGLVSMFVGLGAVIVLWMAVTGLIWVVGLASDRRQRRLRVAAALHGFAYVWFALLLFGSLPIVGALCAWGGGAALAGVARDRHARGARDRHAARALVICAIALGVPLLVLLGLGA